ncbi:MAG: hypothetical protein ACK5Y2_01110 [Bdellovibrionales bacterium]
MGSARLGFFLVLGLGSAGWAQPNPPPSSSVDEAAARARSSQNVQQIVEQTSTQAQGGQQATTVDYASLYRSAVDNMKNGQMGQASATMMAGSLRTEASAQSGSCDPTTVEGLAACTTASVLMGMADLSNQSADSYSTPIATAWSNTCEFSSFGCTQTIPNPFTPIVKDSPQLTPQQVAGVVQILGRRGFLIDSRTGMVTTPDGRRINPNDLKSLQSALGDEKTQELLGQVRAFESAAMRRLRQVGPQQYAKALGLRGFSDAARNVADLARAGGAVPSELSRQPASRESLKARRPSMALFKMYHGQPIGIASDSLFGIVTRRYRVKYQEKTFFSPDPHSTLSP